MGSGGSAVDAMVIGCLGVERRAERFFSYLAILENSGTESSTLCIFFKKKFHVKKKREKRFYFWDPKIMMSSKKRERGA